MTRSRFSKLTLGTRVDVGQFGTHPGVVAEIGPEVTIQGRTLRVATWVRVALDDGRTWSGDFKLLAYRSASPLRAA